MLKYDPKRKSLNSIRNVLQQCSELFLFIEFQTLKSEIQKGLINGKRYENMSMLKLLEIKNSLMEEKSKIIKRNSFLETDIEVMKQQHE